MGDHGARVPDYVTHTGKRQLAGGGGGLGGRDFDPVSIQDNANRLISAKSTRENIMQMASRPANPTSPNGYALDKNDTLESEAGKAYNPYGTKESNRSTLTKDSTRSSMKLEKSKCMVHKYALFFLTVLALLAGIVTVVWFFRSTDQSAPLGNQKPDPILFDECKSSPLPIGGQISFTCSFNTLHQLRSHLTSVDNVTVLDNTGRLLETEYQYESVGSERVLTITKAPAVKCSDAGELKIQFWQEGNRNPIHTATVEISLRPSYVTTSLRQDLVADEPRIGCNTTTVFTFTCSLQNDCTNYEVDIFGRRGGGERSFKDRLLCDSNFHDSRGYLYNCNVALTEEEVEEFYPFSCRFTSPDNSLAQTFSLPNCDVSANCSSSSSSWYFNCTASSSYMKNIREGKCTNFNELNRCFDSGRVLYEFEKGVFIDDDWVCGDNNTVPVCRLSWCVRGSSIVKQENPMSRLCPLYREPTPSLPQA